MRTIIASEKYAGKRIDRVLKAYFAKMPVSAMHKAFRKKDIKVNGVRVKGDCVIMPNDRIDVYISDNILDGIPPGTDHQLNRGFSVVYEDGNILVANKEQGIPVHPDREKDAVTLIDAVREYLKGKNEYDPEVDSSFQPSLCHRLDRNTGGLVIIARNSESLKILLEKIRRREIKRYYQCLVKGRMEREQDELTAYLQKDEKKSRVFISKEQAKGAQKIITRYRVLSCENDISRLEVELLTGRTHQIRAHLAHIGHPVVGDGKYGCNSFNKSVKARYQALWAYKIVFAFTGAGLLSYLKGKTIEVGPEFKIRDNSSIQCKDSTVKIKD